MAGVCVSFQWNKREQSIYYYIVDLCPFCSRLPACRVLRVEWLGIIAQKVFEAFVGVLLCLCSVAVMYSCIRMSRVRLPSSLKRGMTILATDHLKVISNSVFLSFLSVICTYFILCQFNSRQSYRLSIPLLSARNIGPLLCRVILSACFDLYNISLYYWNSCDCQLYLRRIYEWIWIRTITAENCRTTIIICMIDRWHHIKR